MEKEIILEKEIIEKSIKLEPEMSIGIPKDKYYTKEETDILLDEKQDELVSGTNIKTINNESLLGTGNITISAEETDPIFSNSPSSNITNNDITNWNNKSDFSGNYNDLSNKPTIPVVPTNVSAFTNDVGYLTTHQDISGKQDLLVSGSNIKTINNTSLLGSGNITISSGADISIIDANNTTAENLAILQNFYDNYKIGKEVVFYFKNLSNVNKTLIMTFTATDNSTYIDFMDYFIPSYGNYDYGISYKILEKETIRLNLSNNEVVSYSAFNTTETIMLENTTDILGMSNDYEYEPQDDYNPATKKYVDDIVGNINTVLATLTTPSGGGN